jgi:hypothetical protein
LKDEDVSALLEWKERERGEEVKVFGAERVDEC